MKKITIISFLLLFFVISCNQPVNNKTNDLKKDTVQQSEQIDTIKSVVFKIDGGYGYDILINGKIYIHQTIIPAISGIHTFETPEKARKAAAFVVEKMLKGKLPPSVTTKELDSLGVL